MQDSCKTLCTTQENLLQVYCKTLSVWHILLSSNVQWTCIGDLAGNYILCFFFLRVARVMHSFLHLIPPNMYITKAQQRCPPRPPSPSNVVPPQLRPPSTSLCNACISDARVPECERKLTLRAWLQIDISKRHWHVRTYACTYVRTYAHPENRSLIQSLALMCLAIMYVSVGVWILAPKAEVQEKSPPPPPPTPKHKQTNKKINK